MAGGVDEGYWKLTDIKVPGEPCIDTNTLCPPVTPAPTEIIHHPIILPLFLSRILSDHLFRGLIWGSACQRACRTNRRATRDRCRGVCQSGWCVRGKWSAILQPVPTEDWCKYFTDYFMIKFLRWSTPFSVYSYVVLLMYSVGFVYIDSLSTTRDYPCIWIWGTYNG